MSRFALCACSKLRKWGKMSGWKNDVIVFKRAVCVQQLHGFAQNVYYSMQSKSKKLHASNAISTFSCSRRPTKRHKSF